MGFLKRLFTRCSPSKQVDAPQPRRYYIEGLESRCLLTAPAVSGWDFDFEHNPHTLAVTFNQNVGASVAANDVLVDQVTTSDPDPIVTSVSYDSTTNTATFTFPGVLSDGHYRAVIAKEDITNGAASS